MIKHAPDGYSCPFCALVGGTACKGLHSTRDDIVIRDEYAMAFIASHWWEKNPGHVLVIPVSHYENLYDLPDEIGASIFALSRRIAVAMKLSYACDGVSTRQHNEPAGYQDIWHYHLHVFPRYTNDFLYQSYGQNRLTEPKERQPFVAKLREAMAEVG